MSLRESRNGRETAAPIGAAIPRRVGRVATPEELAEQARRDAAIAEAQRRAKEANLWASAAVPARHAQRVDFTGDAWNAKLAALDARRGRGFLAALSGPRGVGKTQMAVELIRRSCREGKSAMFTSAMGFFYELRATYTPTSLRRRDSLMRATRRLLTAYHPALVAIGQYVYQHGAITADEAREIADRAMELAEARGELPRAWQGRRWHRLSGARVEAGT